MKRIGTRSLSPQVNHWLANTQQARILHVFDQSCNLINGYKEIVSIVTAEIGDGPFNLVVENLVRFAEQISLRTQVFCSPAELNLGNLTIETHSAKLWDPHPNWNTLHIKRYTVLQHVKQLHNTQSPVFAPILQSSNSLAHSLAIADISSSITAARQLAGLGIGLTPSGDDFIIGALYAALIIHPPEIAERIAVEIANTAAPLTTSLSASWLRAAAKGEAGNLWHRFFDALISGDPSAIESRTSSILSVGATSGAEALAGFIDTLSAYTEIEKKHVVP